MIDAARPRPHAHVPAAGRLAGRIDVQLDLDLDLGAAALLRLRDHGAG